MTCRIQISYTWIKVLDFPKLRGRLVTNAYSIGLWVWIKKTDSPIIQSHNSIYYESSFQFRKKAGIMHLSILSPRVGTKWAKQGNLEFWRPLSNLPHPTLVENHFSLPNLGLNTDRCISIFLLRYSMVYSFIVVSMNVIF